MLRKKIPLFLENIMPIEPSLDNRESFVPTNEKDAHAKRAISIIRKHPELRLLMKPYPLTFAFTIFLVAIQVGVGIFLLGNPLWLLLLLAFLVGAPVSHGLFVLLHDASHNLVFKSKLANKVVAIIANIGQGFPSAMSFQKFHMLHHAYLDDHLRDADPPTLMEAKAVKGSPIRKIAWLFLLGLIQGMRPEAKGYSGVLEKSAVINFFIIFLTDGFIGYFLGWEALFYIFASTVFGLGIHPIGARWIQEHYLFKEGQQTYSYYGIGNFFGFNIGYHNEHHDLMNVPWIHLPKVKKIAPEFYENLFHHKSWLLLQIYFIFNPNYTLFNRFKVVERDPK